MHGLEFSLAGSNRTGTGLMQIHQSFGNCELFVKLGADKSGAQLAAYQNCNSVIGRSLSERRKHGFARDSDMVNPLLKINKR